MRCNRCFGYQTTVKDSRPGEVHVRRKRECKECGHVWKTCEFSIDEDLDPMTIDRNLAIVKKIGEMFKKRGLKDG